MTDALAAQLLDFLRDAEPPLGRDVALEIAEDTSLLRSGLLDSLALFRLLEWIEAAVGAPVDATAVDVLEDWDTPRAVAAFVVRSRGG